MSVRAVGVLVLGLGIATFMAYLELAGKGPFGSPAVRHLRLMKERVTEPVVVDSVTHGMIAAMPTGLPLARYAPMEQRGARIEGYIQRMFYATDGDLHLEVTPAECRPGERDTVYVTAEITLPMRRRHPGWTFPALFDAFRPNLGAGPPWDAPTRRVRLTGWLMYDIQYDGLRRPADPFRMLWNRFGLQRPYRPAGPSSIWPRLSGWEIHPVTRIEVWDDARGAFREVGP